MSKLSIAIRQAINKMKPPTLVLHGEHGEQDDTDALDAVFHGKRVRYRDGELVGTTLRAGVYRTTRDISIGKRMGY